MQQARLGCLHGGLIAFFAVSSIASRAFAEEGENEPDMVRARFASEAGPALVEARACALRPIGLVDEKGHELDIRTPTHRCRTAPALEDSIPVVVRMEMDDGGKSFVILEAPVLEGVPRAALEEAIKNMGLELKTILEHPPRPPPSGPPTPEPEPEPEPDRTKTTTTTTTREWYGWQTLILDGTSAALCATIIGVFVGVPGLVIGPPIVHWVHGNVGTGFASLGMRAGLAGGGGGIGAAIGAAADAPSGSGNGPAIGALTGVIIGTLGAIALDAVVLAYEDKTVHGTGFRLTPGGLSGVF